MEVVLCGLFFTHTIWCPGGYKSSSFYFPITSRNLDTGKSSIELGRIGLLGLFGILFSLDVDFVSHSLDTRFFFPGHPLLRFPLSTMAALQKPVSSPLRDTLAAGCLLVMVLCAQGGAAAPVTSHCRLNESDFQEPYIFNHTFTLAQEVLISVFLFCILSTWNLNRS